MAAVADSGPVLVLAGIAAAGSFTHIRDTAAEHGQGGWMAWAVAVCIDLTCVMAARERQQDKRTKRRTAPLSWPTLVLVGGIVLSLAANLAQAERSCWGWLSAATPAVAFLVAVSMLERRASGAQPVPSALPSSDTVTSAAVSSSPWVVWEDGRPAPSGAVPDEQDEQDERGPADEGDQHTQDEPDGQTEIPLPVPASDEPAAPSPPASPTSPAASPLVDFARRVATEHHNQHGRPITRDALRARLGVSNQLASDLLHQVRTDVPA
ncbi:DUF2637 domain-containing protein [Actinomadura roseirufa]|uniref:DUF2637 domain-containing protein n=1 Tax=Actinomadura roseirufa TaxID=2094049 RepID=UPI00279528DC|nr:DUF2637 domain-containing protein [Actinomadura roseirufa]